METDYIEIVKDIKNSYPENGISMTLGNKFVS